MAKLVPENHPALHAIAEEVPHSDITSPRIKKIIRDLRAVLASYEGGEFVGVAIAAPQIGVPLRLFIVADTRAKNKDDDNADTTNIAPKLPSLVAINPTLTKQSKRKTLSPPEGCLSVAGRYGSVSRSLRATLRAYDERGAQYERGASGLLAQIFQHEVDHLDGILFTDRAEKILPVPETPPRAGKKT